MKPMAKGKTDMNKTLYAIAAIAIIALVGYVFVNGSVFGKGQTTNVPPQPTSQPQGTGIQYTSVTALVTFIDKWANTATAVAGSYYYRLPGGMYTAAASATTAGVSISSLPVGVTGFEVAFQNTTSAQLIYLETYKFDLLDSQGHITNFVTKTLPAAKVGTTYGEWRKSNSNLTTIDLSAGEDNVDTTLFFRQNTANKAWRKPAVCLYYNITDFTGIKLKNLVSGAELPTMAIPSRLVGTTSQGGVPVKCYDLTSVLPAYTPDGTGLDTMYASYLKGIQSAQVAVELQASNVLPATPVSNVTARWVGVARYFDKDNNNILEGTEDINNAYAAITANIADGYSYLPIT
jgi:hypothetical protein